jgi:PAS domain S-box-containing protein
MDRHRGKETLMSARPVSTHIPRRSTALDDLSLIADQGDVIYQTTPDGVIEWIAPNVADLLGWAPEDLIGSTILEIVHAADRDLVAQRRIGLYSGNLAVDGFAARLRTAEGRYRDTTIRARPFHDTTGAVVGAFAAIRDAHEATTTLRALATLSRGNGVLVRAREEQELLEEMCLAVVEAGRYALAWYGRAIHDERRTVQPIAWAGGLSEYVDEVTITWDDSPTGLGPTGTAIRMRTTQVKDSFEDADYDPWRDVAQRHGFRASISLPVVVDGVTDGALMVYALEEGTFDDVSRGLLEDLAADIGYGIERLRDAERLTEALKSSVFVLAAAVESRDPYTAGHQSHVGVLAEAIGRDLGLDEDRIQGLVLGASIHDLGKIAISHATLGKSGVLTDAEWVELKAHPVTGWTIANRFPWPWPIAEMIHQHHERMDGSGYPLGLAGDAILLESRIIAVADLYEAMANDRPYRTAPGADRARTVLSEGRGTLFDPDVIDAFERVVTRGFTFPTG